MSTFENLHSQKKVLAVSTSENLHSQKFFLAVEKWVSHFGCGICTDSMLNDFFIGKRCLIDLEHALDSNNLKVILSNLENDGWDQKS